MTAGAFDVFLIVDWSAANTPKRGKDSIWIAEARASRRGVRLAEPANPPTRSDAMALIKTRIDDHLACGRRVFIGFDFPFGYPAGATEMIAGAARWDALWHALAQAVEDGDDNRSNRFALAEQWNRDRFGAPLYWGRPHQHRYDSLPATKPTHDAFKALQWRIIERWRPPAKSVWQLAYNGAVGSQAMLGMARLEGLHRALGARAKVWPFETQWDAKLDARIVIAEVYPSMFETALRDGEVKDAAQVRTVATLFAERARDGAFRPWLSRPDGLSDDDNEKALAQEGWIVGAGHEESGA